MSSALWAPSEISASEPDNSPAASLSTVRPALAATENRAARRLAVASSIVAPIRARPYRSAGGKANRPEPLHHALPAHDDSRHRSRRLAGFLRRQDGHGADAPVRRRQGPLHAGVPGRARRRGGGAGGQGAAGGTDLQLGPRGL